MSIDQLAPRILNLPADVRAALARVDGPGWYLSPRDGGWYLCDLSGREETGWPANPASAVAAVTGWPLSACHAIIGNRLQTSDRDDHAAALSIIEAHCAGRSPNA